MTAVHRTPHRRAPFARARGRRALAALVALVPLLSLPACSSTPKEPSPTWVRSDEVEPLVAPSEGVLWEVTVVALERMGFPLGSGMDPTTLTAVTGWKNELAVFRGRGKRVQAELHYEALGDDRYAARVRVKQQQNMSLVNQLDPTYADWEWTGDDVDRAEIILQHVRARLAPAFELQKEAADPLRPWRQRP